MIIRILWTAINNAHAHTAVNTLCARWKRVVVVNKKKIKKYFIDANKFAVRQRRVCVCVCGRSRWQWPGPFMLLPRYHCWLTQWNAFYFYDLLICMLDFCSISFTYGRSASVLFVCLCSWFERKSLPPKPNCMEFFLILWTVSHEFLMKSLKWCLIKLKFDGVMLPFGSYVKRYLITYLR